MIPFVDLAAQHRALGPEIGAALEGVLARCDFILGAEVGEFERAFASFVGAAHGVGMSSGCDALSLALRAIDVGPGDEVIVPTNSYIATALAVSSVGAQPVLVDCDPCTYNVDAASIERAITPRTRAIIPVHLTGQAADMDAVLALASRHGLQVVEDAAQAHGTLHRGRPCGSLGVMGCFSFYPGKNLGAYGDGGMVVTSDARLADRLRRLRNYGQEQKYRHVEKGSNARLDTLQAAILGVKLPRLRAWNEARRGHAARYRDLLAGVAGLALQQCAPFSTHIYHLFVVETDRRDVLQRHLSERGIQTGIHYPVPIHLQQAYQELGYKKGDFPNAERLASRILSLPMFPELTGEQIGCVARTVREFFESPAGR